jgi:hypothetical protein
MRREPEFFDDQELVLVYMARRLKHSLAVEKILDEGNVDYVLETGPYQSGLLFRSTKVGVYFYATSAEEGRVRALLSSRGYGI